MQSGEPGAGTGKQKVRRVIDQLRREAGHGRIGQLEAGLGKRRGWLRQRRYVGSIELGQVLQALRILGVPPAKFFRRAIGTAQPAATSGPPRPEPPIVARAWQRFAEGSQGDLGRGYLDELDKALYENPRRVVERAGEIVAHVELGHLPLLLAVAASAYRLWDMRLAEAEHAIRAGLDIADRQDDIRHCGTLFQRLSYVKTDQDELVAALRCAEKAVENHLLTHNLPGAGEALFDRAQTLYYLDQYLESIETASAALKYLSPERQSSRCGALQLLGLCHRELGEPQTARDFAARAEELADGLPPRLQAKLAWLQARISEDLGEPAEAAAQLEAVVELLRSIHPGEAAIAAVDLVRVQLRNGRKEDARRVAREIHDLAEPLGRHPPIAAALEELRRVASEGA